MELFAVIRGVAIGLMFYPSSKVAVPACVAWVGMCAYRLVNGPGL